MKYRAQVTKVNKKNGTIKVKCPNVWGNQESPWCYPCVPFVYKDLVRLPKEKENVWIEFEQDDTMSTPIYVGTWGDDEFWASV